MANTLPITGSSGTQTTTQNPQGSVRALNTGTPTGNVQPVTNSSLLNSHTGVALTGGSLSTVSLAPSANTQTSTAATPAPKHHFNAGLFGVSIALCLVAVILFWLTSRSAKSTTNI